jgi:hypothetical protein
MSISTPSPDRPLEAALADGLATDAPVWDGLKLAISQSSGFERWKQDCDFDLTSQETSVDALVHRYLRETLETLAY